MTPEELIAFTRARIDLYERMMVPGTIGPAIEEWAAIVAKNPNAAADHMRELVSCIEDLIQLRKLERPDHLHRIKSQLDRIEMRLAAIARTPGDAMTAAELARSPTQS